MTVRIAMVNPLTRFGDGAYDANVANAAAYVAEAARQGAGLVCLPESYPGEWRSPVTRTPVRELQEMARANGIYVVGGFTEPIDGDVSRCYNTLILLAPDGEEVGRYRRTTPSHAPWIYLGGEYWDFDWTPADELPVFDTEFGRVGLLMCSEVYAPELARILALKGAEIILLPAGLISPVRDTSGYGGALYETWRTLAWARAIENLACTAVCSNVTAEGGKALTIISSPEEVLLEEHDEGVHCAELDIKRVRWLRQEHDRTTPGEPLWRTKPGNLRDWRRKEVLVGNPILTEG